MYIQIGGTKYNINQLVKNPSSLNKGSYYFALKYDKVVYIAPKTITKAQAESIMKMTKSSNAGISNVWTYNAYDAYNISTAYGTPDLHGPHEVDSVGYFAHYHTHNHTTNAHAYFGEST